MADDDPIVVHVQGDELEVLVAIAIEHETSGPARIQGRLELQIRARLQRRAQIDNAPARFAGTGRAIVALLLATADHGPGPALCTGEEIRGAVAEVLHMIERQLRWQDLHLEVVIGGGGLVRGQAHESLVQADFLAIEDARREGMTEPVHAGDRDRHVRAVDRH